MKNKNASTIGALPTVSQVGWVVLVRHTRLARRGVESSGRPGRYRRVVEKGCVAEPLPPLGGRYERRDDTHQALPQVFVEKFEGARPRQFGGRLVVTRRRVVVE